MSNRESQAAVAAKLQTVLNRGKYNGDYSIRFDMCDSGVTFCYYKGELYKRVPNDEMRGSLNVIDYYIQNNRTPPRA